MKPGKYQHYKGNFYQVLGVCFNSETLEELVIYRQIQASKNFPSGTLWARPKKMFLEKVEVGKKVLPCFRYVEK